MFLLEAIDEPDRRWLMEETGRGNWSYRYGLKRWIDRNFDITKFLRELVSAKKQSAQHEENDPRAVSNISIVKKLNCNGFDNQGEELTSSAFTFSTTTLVSETK